MKILVIGSGGREHALAWKLSQSDQIYALPGNPGIAEVAEIIPSDLSVNSAIEAAKALKPQLVVIGPEDPLIAGVADALRSEGFDVFGPGADGAALEGSKAFSKELMTSAGVPTADFQIFTDAASAKDYANKKFAEGRQVVVKASGAALGKGVVVCSTLEEAVDSIDAMLLDRSFGAAGSTVVIEDRLSGFEFSLLTLCNGRDILSLPVAQDYKRALDGDRGPNTGGMGTYSPVPSITLDLVRETEERVVKPALDALRRRGIDYRGTLFSGLMVQEGEPHCLEFNVRFGDPETQSIMLRLGDGLGAALHACATGTAIPPVEILPHAAVTVVLASGGYPGDYAKGKPISVGPLPTGVHLFHAGTRLVDGHLVTSGGRVMAVSASRADLAAARQLAYEGAQCVQFEGKQMRTDIAHRVS